MDAMAVEGTTLIPELEEYKRQFLEARDAFPDLVAGLSDEDFNWRPGEGRWSIAESIDHLCAMGPLMIKQIDVGIENAIQNGWKNKGPFKYSAIGNWFVRAVGPRQEGKKQRTFKAPEQYAPSSNHTIGRLEQAFSELQDEFVARLERANGLDLARVKIASPVTRLLKFSLGQWFALLAGHQLRHFQQAGDVRAQLEAHRAA